MGLSSGDEGILLGATSRESLWDGEARSLACGGGLFEATAKLLWKVDLKRHTCLQLCLYLDYRIQCLFLPKENDSFDIVGGTEVTV